MVVGAKSEIVIRSYPISSFVRFRRDCRLKVPHVAVNVNDKTARVASRATMLLPWLLLLSFVPSVTPQSLNNSSPFVWGAFRPNLYFGLRPRIPQSLMTGLIWFGTQDYQSFTSMSFFWCHVNAVVLIPSTEARHACDQGDGLNGYTWTQFDAREGGIQVLKDTENNVKVTTELLIVDGGEHGGSWAARIKGEPINEGSNIPCMSYFRSLSRCAQGNPHVHPLSSTLVLKAWEVSSWKQTKMKMCATTCSACSNN